MFWFFGVWGLNTPPSFKKYFYWRIIALHNFLFSVQPQHESAIGIHMSLPFEPPSHLQPHLTPLVWYRALVWDSWAILKIPIGYLLYIWQCKFPCYSFHTAHPLLPSPHVHKSIPYACFSITVMKINSSVPFSYILYICVRIQ